MKIAVYYHCRVSGGACPETPHSAGSPPVDRGNAIPIVLDQMMELERSGLKAAAEFFVIGVNGGNQDTNTIWDLCKPDCLIINGPDSDTELPTLNFLKSWCTPGWAVLYHHSKGVRGVTPGATEMRRCMQHHTVTNWRQCVKDLETHDMAGAHWLTAAAYPEHAKMLSTPFWGGGNFWWATSDYLATLPPVKEPFTWDNRYYAETWVGYGVNPRIKDYAPHFPCAENCATFDKQSTER